MKYLALFILLSSKLTFGEVRDNYAIRAYKFEPNSPLSVMSCHQFLLVTEAISDTAPLEEILHSEASQQHFTFLIEYRATGTGKQLLDKTIERCKMRKSPIELATSAFSDVLDEYLNPVLTMPRYKRKKTIHFEGEKFELNELTDWNEDPKELDAWGKRSLLGTAETQFRLTSLTQNLIANLAQTDNWGEVDHLFSDLIIYNAQRREEAKSVIAKFESEYRARSVSK